MKQPLPSALQQVDSTSTIESEIPIRQMADVVVWLDRISPLGYCLRQSMTHYWFRRRIDLPLVVHFATLRRRQT